MVDSRTYRILGLLGEGGFGKVYRARLESGAGFQQDVALKLLHDAEPGEALLQRFRDEARILGLVRDRAFVSVSPPVQLEGRWGVVMEYVEGCTLEDLLRRFGPLPPGVAAEVVGEVARALHAVSEQVGPDGQPIELIHRDLKPANLQITRTGEVKVLDFGIARANFQRREFRTEASIGGTPGFIAPERLRGQELPAGDIYSLGVVLAHSVAASDEAEALVSRTLTGTSGDVGAADPAVGVPVVAGAGELLELARAMCQPDPSLRPTARQVERRCAAIAREVGGLGLREWAEIRVPDAVGEHGTDDLVGHELVTTLIERADSGPAPVPSNWRTRAVWGVAGVVALGVLGVVGWLGWPRSDAVGASPAPEPLPVSAPAPAPIPTPEPAPVVPEPAPAARPTAAPVAAPPRPAPSSEPPVRIWVKTKPFGRVEVDGQDASTDQWLDGVRPGPRTLKLRSNDGRRHDWQVDVVPGQDNRFCWDFEKGDAC